MSVGPRIVFTRFVTGESPKLQPWRDHLARVVGATVTSSVPKADDVLVWHLVSANNRVLARSAWVFSSFDEATVSARATVDAGAELAIVPVSEERIGTYGWYATLAGETVATCSRWYVTERDRRHSIALALTSLPHATLLPGARLMDPALMGGSRE